jgi:hypothetical protein
MGTACYVCESAFIGQSRKETHHTAKKPEQIYRKRIGRIASPVGPLVMMVKTSDGSYHPVS